MANLDVTRDYSDGEVLTEAQLDSIKTDIENFFNATKISGDNIQTSGLTGSLKFAAASLSSSKIADSAIIGTKMQGDLITTVKIIDEAVTNDKIAPSAVTSSKLTSLFLPTQEGAIRLFHTFNSTVSVPRGWMICNGDQINETNYNAIHGAGGYAADGISASNLLNKNTPSFLNVFAVGDVDNDTTQDGSAAITTSGNASHEVSIGHSHVSTGTDHKHTPRDSVVALKQLTTATTTAHVRGTSHTLVNDSTFSLSSTGTLTVSAEPSSIEFLFLIRVI